MESNARGAAHRTDARQEAVQSSQAWRKIQQEFFSTAGAEPVQKGLTALADAMVIQACKAFARLPDSGAVFAAGPYGRQELFPFSEIDLLFLHDDNPRPELAETLAALACGLRDAGLPVNYSTATVKDALRVNESNFEWNIALLDQRFLAGDPAIQAELDAARPSSLSRHGSKLVRRLSGLARERHARYWNTHGHLAPDVNDAPGGWRDVQLIARLAELCPGRIGADQKLEAPKSFLASLRCFLHYHAGSDWNVLDRDARDGILQPPFTRAATSEAWMREYYAQARTIFNRARRMLAVCETNNESMLFRDYCDTRAQLSNGEFTVSRERIFLRQPARLHDDPGMILRLCGRIAHLGIPAAPPTEQRVEAASRPFGAWCADRPEFWPVLSDILSQPRADMALRLLHDLALLDSIFPEWRDVDGLFVDDAEHRFTSDEHSLAAIACVCRLRRPIEPPIELGQQRFSELLDEIDDPALLLFALLFHETGKSAGEDGDWTWRSAARAREAAERLHMPHGDQATAAFLIEQQWQLAQVLGIRDPDDPALARRLAAQTGTIEHLKLLTVFTYADVSATYPGAMTPWRREQLWRVYEAVRRELTVELETDRIGERPGNLPEEAEFVRGFPVRYLRAHTDAEIAAHIRLHELSEPSGVAVHVEPIEGAFRLTVIAHDRPYLFAALAGAISSFHLNILKAEAFANDAGQVLDTFVFAAPSRFELGAVETSRLQDMVRRIALGKIDLRRIAQSAPRPESWHHRPPACVRFDSEACATATLVEIVGDDRPGLLCNLAGVFSAAGCNIDVVLIDTKGGRVMDVFYVAHQGAKLSTEMQVTLHEKLLAAC